MMKRISYLIFGAFSAIAVGVGCQPDSAADKIENTSEDAMHETGQAMEETGEAASDAADETKDAVEDAAN